MSKSKPQMSVIGKTIFEKVINREIPAKIIYEDEWVIAFNDIEPQGPVHFLIVSKRKIPSLDDCTNLDLPVLGNMLMTAKKLGAEKLPKGYRIVINNGNLGGQNIYHLHLHVIGGRAMKWPPG